MATKSENNFIHFADYTLREVFEIYDKWYEENSAVCDSIDFEDWLRMKYETPKWS